MDRKQRSLVTAMFVLATLALAPQQSQAHVQEDDKTTGAFTIYVKANITAPAQSATFHTGGTPSMGIDYSSVSNLARVTPDGTQSQTNFNYVLDLANSESGTLDIESTVLTIPAGVTTPYQFGANLSKSNHTTSVGGRTAFSNSQAYSGGHHHDVTDAHSFSVVNP